jgi:hypothetical protein
MNRQTNPRCSETSIKQEWCMNTRNPMLPLARRLLALPFVLGLLALPLSLAAAATHKAESRGISEPPFLSYGVKSNLLLLLDNSGSMLDMAEGGPAGQCFDDGYLKNPTTAALDPSREYAGYFKPDSWYVWRESYYTDAGNTRPYLTDGAYPTVAHWAKNTAYSNGALVIDNGVFFKASCSGACTSSATAANISEDNLINWLPATDVYAWEAGSTYPAGSYVKHKSQFYYLQSPTTGSFQSKDDPATDTGHWQPVNYTWLPEKSYTAGTIVTYNGMVFRAATASQATGSGSTKGISRRWRRRPAPTPRTPTATPAAAARSPTCRSPWSMPTATR